ncbi:hypothetical protein CRYPA_1165 [uncultured Candidatus Thioglobus sp.]|nr:hypothetical protein CRYPA_1165 [uncultured Candidatus Thioglobus sp.]
MAQSATREIYPIVYLDGIVIKVRQANHHSFSTPPLEG